MELRFLADADLNHQIVTGLARLDPEIDFQSAVEAGLEGLTDPKVLHLAARAGRVLTQIIAEEMTLQELRRARKITQVRMAKTLGIGQDGISKPGITSRFDDLHSAQNRRGHGRQLFPSSRIPRSSARCSL